MNVEQSLSSQLKIARKKSGLTQNELKDICGISTFTISGIERGTIESVTTYTLQKLQKALEFKFEL